QLRRLPGGWLGWLMLLTTILDLIGEFGVAKTVTKIYRASAAFQEYGMIIDMSQTFQMFPDIHFGAYTLALLAQEYSASNANITGMGEDSIGIYRFIPQDVYNFMANEDDVIGKWNCATATQNPITYDQQYTDPDIFVD